LLIELRFVTSTKCINNDYLFNVVLGLATVIQNAVTFFKLISFTNAAICNSHIIKSKHMIYECGYLNSRILKSFFTIILKHETYAFFLFGASRFLFVSALVFLSSSASFIVFSYHCKFVSIRSLSSSPMVYNFFSFHLFVCFLTLAKGSLTLHFLFCFCSRVSSRFL